MKEITVYLCSSVCNFGKFLIISFIHNKIIESYMAPVYGVAKFSLMIFLEIRLQTVQETSGFGFWIEPKYLNRNIGQPNFYL